MAHHHFPDDLIETQREWNDTYAALAHGDPVRTTVMRRRLLALSRRLVSHPFWGTPPGGTSAVWGELRCVGARAEPEGDTAEGRP